MEKLGDPWPEGEPAALELQGAAIPDLDRLCGLTAEATALGCPSSSLTWEEGAWTWPCGPVDAWKHLSSVFSQVWAPQDVAQADLSDPHGCS